MADQGLHVERRFVFILLSILFCSPCGGSLHLIYSVLHLMLKQKTGDSESLCVGCKVTRVINYYQVKLP